MGERPRRSLVEEPTEAFQVLRCYRTRAMRTRFTFLLFVLSSVSLSSACGTATFDHVVKVSIVDPSRRLGNPPIEVGIFDKSTGQSEEWARRTMGVASPATPYTGTVCATDTKTFFDSSLPERVEMGLAVPAYESTGYFIVSLQPVPGEDQRVTASFARYGSYFARADSKVVPLPLRVRSGKGKEGWQIDMTIEVPPPSVH